MNRRGTVGSALVAGGLILLLRGSAPRPVTPPKAASSTQTNQTSQPGKAPTEDGPWRASQEHFAGTQANDCPAPAGESSTGKQSISLSGVTLRLEQRAAGASGAGDLRKNRWCIPSEERVQAMIAVAPDPVHTHLPLAFDRTVEAVQLAAESMNYVSDRYWLPWDTQLKPQFPDYESSRRALKEQGEKENQPGLLLYRWNGDANKPHVSLVYVFLVTDTPSTGLNGRQFSNAVEYVRQICNKNDHVEHGCAAGDPIRIMGPTFSGSVASLPQLSAAWGNQEFVAYSGTVSSECALQNQHLLDKPSDLCELASPQYKKASHVTLKSFVTSTEFSIQRFIDFLGGKRQIDCDPHLPPKVAILSEAATSFGSALRGQLRARGRFCWAAITSFSFPRDISSLRNAYETTGTQAAASGNKSADATRTYLPLNLGEQLSNRSDEPQDFSPQGPLSKEAVLMKFASELRRGHYQYIGISGSNVLDVLFLANFLRTACPDARLFVPDADLLFERDLDNASYIGSLAISTYPLISENLDWTHPQPPPPAPQHSPAPRRPFSGQFEQGQYNATLSTLYELLDQKAPDFYECRGPFVQDQTCSPERDKLPVWVEVVGTGGYWPVEILSSGTKKSGLEADDFSLAWKGTILLLCIVGLVHVWVLLTWSPIAGHFRDFSLVGPLPKQRLFFVHVASASLVLALSMLMVPWFENWQPPPGWGQPRVLLLLVVTLAMFTVLAVVLALAWFTLSYWFRWKVESAGGASRPGIWFQLGIFVIWVGTVVVGGLWHSLFAEKEGLSSHYGLFFAYRTMHVESGVSPIAPMLLLLAVIYLWSIFELWRLQFNDQDRPMLSRIGGSTNTAPAGQQVECLPGTRSEQRVADSITKFLFQGSYVVAFIVVYLVWLLFFRPDHPFQLFEAPAFQWVYEALFMLSVLIMLSSGFRFGQIWSELRMHLLELERSPIRLAFGRLKEASWSPIWRQGGQEAEWTNMARSFQAARQIRNCFKVAAPQIRNCFKVAAPLALEIGSLGDDRAKIKDQAMIVRNGKLKITRFCAVRVGLEYMGFYKSETSLTDIFNDFQQHWHNIQVRFAGILNDIWPALDAHWNEECCPEQCGEPGDTEKPVVVYCKPEKADPKAVIIRCLEEYAALRYVAFIRAAFRHLRHALVFVGIAFSLVLLSLNVYSFEPHKSLIWSLTVIFFVVGFTVVRSLMQMHRDPVVSLITGTKPNELGFEFYLRVIGYGAVPVLTLLATHFPSIGKFLASFLQPGLEALK